jgi:hypothetical protein
MSNAKVIYEKDGVRVTETEWSHFGEAPFFEAKVERADGKDSLGVMRWVEDVGWPTRVLAKALAGEARNCARLVQQHHSVVQRSVELANDLRKLREAVRLALTEPRATRGAEMNALERLVTDPDDLEDAS